VEDTETFSDIERFTCSMYGLKSVASINEGRYLLFMNATANEKKDLVLDIANNVDATLFPPSQTELRYQFLRARYVSSIWSNYYKKQPSLLTSEGNGWTLENDDYCFQWFSGDMIPQDVAKIVFATEDMPENEDDNTDEQSDQEDVNEDMMNELSDENESDDDSSYEMDSEFEDE
jgi:hypothetical protein